MKSNLQTVDGRSYSGMAASRLGFGAWLAASTLLAPQLSAETIRLAAASNFSQAAEVLKDRFEKKSDHELVLIFGSTGKLYAQIRNGAPFDVFLAADVVRPELLEHDGVVPPKTRFTYARGRLLLWSPQSGYVDSEGRVLSEGAFAHLAIANPKLAPYGRAAEEVLRKLGLWTSLQNRLVRGENINQAYHFVRSRNAELGFVAFSQVLGQKRTPEGSWWEVPQGWYAPIEQQAVLVKDGKAARSFLSFLRSEPAREIVRAYGYEVP